MQTATITKLRKNLPFFMEEVNKNHEPLYITGKKNNIVIISEDDWNSYQETLYLLSSPNNANRLINSLNSNDFINFDSIEDLKNEAGL
ncbi:MAG TPA: type II toxin-antitoxin system Phd/YefM family antitoxin [Spirochaetota bacterium]|nr:type II toxin-antitoxin system Phd/YefM family antitoxin [Spirochaetota bacterium]